MINNLQKKVILIFILIFAASCSQQRSEVNKDNQKISKQINYVIVEQATYTPQATLTALPSLTSYPTKTPNIVFVTATSPVATITIVPEQPVEMHRFVPCGNDFLINVYDFKEEYGLGNGKKPNNDIFKIVRMELINLQDETLDGLYVDTFSLEGSRKADGKVLKFNTDKSNTDYSNEGKRGDALGKSYYYENTQFVPRVSVKLNIVYDVNFKLENYTLVFKPENVSLCELRIPLK